MYLYTVIMKSSHQRFNYVSVAMLTASFRSTDGNFAKHLVINLAVVVHVHVCMQWLGRYMRE